MTFEVTQDQIDSILEWSETKVPYEACGVIADGKFWPCNNLMHGRINSFILDPKDYLAIAKHFKVEAIVHTHVEIPPAASDPDRTGCEKIQLPYVIVSWPTGQYCVIEPCGYIAPLEGRVWGYGTHDCLALVRDALKIYGNIDMPDYDREEWEWWKKGGNYLEERFEQAGFVRMPQGTIPRQLDVFGIMLNSKVVNHLAVFLEPDTMLHQLQEQMSVKQQYGGVYQKATKLHLRHKSMVV